MKVKNGIILAGGNGTRLAPLTTYTLNKHLIPVDGKFIIDYPINTLKQMGIENITVVLGGNHFSQVVSYLKDGRDHQVNFNYVFQGEARGIAQGIDICERFVKDDTKFAVCLGDNIFENPIEWDNSDNNAKIILNKHENLSAFGVASLKDNKIVKIEEKPKNIDYNYDNYAITGCYLFDQQYFEFFKKIKPSNRNEYEIVEVIYQYLEKNQLSYAWAKGLWSDAGTFSSIDKLNNYFYNKKNGNTKINSD